MCAIAGRTSALATSQCFDENDKARIMAAIEQYPDGMQGFNVLVHALMEEIRTGANEFRKRQVCGQLET